MSRPVNVIHHLTALGINSHTSSTLGFTRLCFGHVLLFNPHVGGKVLACYRLVRYEALTL